MRFEGVGLKGCGGVGRGGGGREFVGRRGLRHGIKVRIYPSPTDQFKLKYHLFLAKSPDCCPHFDVLFRKIAKFSPKYRVSRNFAKIEGNFAKHETENFTKLRKRKFSQPP